MLTTLLQSQTPSPLRMTLHPTVLSPAQRLAVVSFPWYVHRLLIMFLILTMSLSLAVMVSFARAWPKQSML